MGSSSSNDGAGQAIKQLFRAKAHIWKKHCLSYVSSMCLKCATELSIPEEMHSHGGPMTLNQLVEAIPLQNDDLCTVETAHGMNPWDPVARTPMFGCLFNGDMVSDSRLAARVLTDRCKWLFKRNRSWAFPRQTGIACTSWLRLESSCYCYKTVDALSVTSSPFGGALPLHFEGDHLLPLLHTQLSIRLSWEFYLLG
ncbi:hypothetical protein CRG98_022964 [Punica granatum]|uniref:O-methyltransferase dimerisation domain-containing protein n=1 Tax=Punica granatum TaxID=22663 RepID=A0A2I0JK63_PUNGR|nr:hypothetical protein CRG98_022964 [Punica granatum]